MQIIAHSAFTASSPRSRNCRQPLACLICPFIAVVPSGSRALPSTSRAFPSIPRSFPSRPHALPSKSFALRAILERVRISQTFEPCFSCPGLQTIRNPFLREKAPLGQRRAAGLSQRTFPAGSVYPPVDQAPLTTEDPLSQAAEKPVNASCGNCQALHIKCLDWPSPFLRKPEFSTRNFGLAAFSARDPSCHHSRRCERNYSSISHLCRPMPAMFNRKADQEWYREKKENDVT